MGAARIVVAVAVAHPAANSEPHAGTCARAVADWQPYRDAARGLEVERRAQGRCGLWRRSAQGQVTAGGRGGAETAR